MGISKVWVMAISSILNFFMPMTVAVDSNCDFYQSLVMGDEYYVYNPDYPAYSSGNCRWLGESVKGSRIVISCEDISLPSTPNCNGDKLRISLSGDPNFSDSNNYCGEGAVTLVTKSNAVAVAFTGSRGRFLCSMTSVMGNLTNSGTSPPNAGPMCDCGWEKATRIVGGVETGINEFPYMVGLVDTARREVYCGATIISNRYILSAAHCVYQRSAAGIGALVGDHDLTSGSETTTAALYQISVYEYHPDYNATSQINDIAILRTSKPITFSIYVGPVCLPFRYTSVSFDGETVTAVGWGQTEFTGPKSDVLQKVSLQVTDLGYCASMHPAMQITFNQICTYAPGKDTCQSDSGGPVLWKDYEKRRNQLVGIISYGLGCATARPGVNTRVSSYIVWIVSRTSDASYCIK